MVEKDNVDAYMISLIGIFGAVATYLIVIGLQVLFYRFQNADHYAKNVVPGHREAREVQLEQTQELQGYRWVDKDKEWIAIPIGRAMDSWVRQWQANPGNR